MARAIASPISEEVAVKGAFLVSFAKFVEWPVTTTSLGFCVIGDGRMASYLEANIAGTAIDGRLLSVRNQPDLAQLSSCSVIYIGREAKAVVAQIAQTVAGKHILTVSEFPELGARGVAVSFFIDEERVRFEVNLGAVSQAELTISSKLLALARITGGNK